MLYAGELTVISCQFTVERGEKEGDFVGGRGIKSLCLSLYERETSPRHGDLSWGAGWCIMQESENPP